MECRFFSLTKAGHELISWCDFCYSQTKYTFPAAKVAGLWSEEPINFSRQQWLKKKKKKQLPPKSKQNDNKIFFCSSVDFSVVTVTHLYEVLVCPLTSVLSSNRNPKLTLARTHDSNCFSRWYAFDKGFLPKAHFTFSPSIIFVINFETGFTSFWVVVSWPVFAMRRVTVNDTSVVWSSLSLATFINFTALFYIILYTYFIFHHKSKK